MENRIVDKKSKEI